MYFLWLVRVKSFRRRKKSKTTTTGKKSNVNKRRETTPTEVQNPGATSRAAECRRLSSVVEEDGEETVETQKSLETESSVELSQWESMRKWSVPVSPEQIGSYSAARRINPRIAAVNPQVFQRYRQSRGSDSSSASGGEPEDNKQETRLEECFSNLTLTAK